MNDLEKTTPGVGPMPGPTYREVTPDFKVLCSSAGHNWHGVFVGSYWLAPQLDPVPSPVIDGDILQLSLNSFGNLRAFYDRKSERAYAAPGYIIVQPRHMSVDYTWDQAARVCHLYLSPDLMASAAGEMGRRNPAHVELLWRFFTPDPLIEQIAFALLAELDTPTPLGRIYAESLVQSLALHLLRNHSTLSATRSVPKDGLSRHQLVLVLEYIHAHLADDIALDTLAHLAGLSPAYFSRQFKTSMGMPPYQYVICCRVERARALLLQGELTVTEVAQLVGFTDHSHLARHFKRVLGASISEVRQNRRNVHVLGMNVQARDAKPSLE